MPPERTPPRARSAQGPHRSPYRRSNSPTPEALLPAVTTIRVVMPTPTSGGSVQSPDTPSEGSAPESAPGMPLDIRLFVRARLIAAGGSPSSPFLLEESRETASPRPRSPLQRRRHGSESPRRLPVPLQPVSRSGIKKTSSRASRQSPGRGRSPRPNATSSQRKSTSLSRASRRIASSEAEAVRILDEVSSASGERLRSSECRADVVENEGTPMTPPVVRPQVSVEPTENGNGDEAGPPARRLVRRGVRRASGVARNQPPEAPANENEPPRQRGARRTVRRRRAVTTNTVAPAVGLNGQQLGADGRVAPVVEEPVDVPALPQQVARENTDDQRRQPTRAHRGSRSQGGEQPPRQQTREALRAGGRLLTMTNPAAEERFIQGVLQLQRRVEETFVPDGQPARAPAPQARPRRVGLSEIPMNALNNGPVVVRGREVRQGVATLRQQPRQRPGARTHQDNLRGALGM
ncbi:hypothetical protein TWF281_011328 [Arthrobotrys megalospora]